MQDILDRDTPPLNKILGALPGREYERVVSKVEHSELAHGQILFEPEDTINDVYFPESGIVSLLSVGEGGRKMGVGMVGKEGIVGLPVFLGFSKLANLAVVHGEGSAWKMKSIDFINLCELGGVLPRLLHRYTHFFITQLSQVLICTRFHGLEARLVCWVLLAHDKMGTDNLAITQSALANLLGVRREAVTTALGHLQQRELVKMTRGNLSIIDRKGLEGAVCPCYLIAKEAGRTFLN